MNEEATLKKNDILSDEEEDDIQVNLDDNEKPLAVGRCRQDFREKFSINRFGATIRLFNPLFFLPFFFRAKIRASGRFKLQIFVQSSFKALSQRLP